MFASELLQELISGFSDPWDGGQTDAWAQASCRDETGGLTSLFFSDQIPDILRAREICSTCALIEPCFEAALDRREPWGVWGGQLFLNGHVLSQKRKRGRPPKNQPDGIQLTA